ncbi:MAG TPA: endonuclease/exonuclease/phosphatase family protein [Polyangiaceae bacterium]|jgi:endonuclease/exonuclease/phosphatase family metal-dependent hydrolase
MASPFRAMTFNIRTAAADDGPNHWDLRKELVAKTIRENDPDLLGVQEPTESQWEEMSRALAAKWTGVAQGRRDGRERLAHLQGLFYRTERFDRIRDGVFWLSDTPHVPGSISWAQDWGARICVWAHLMDKELARELVFAVVHVDTAEAAWLPSVKVLSGELPPIATGAPIVLVGDFNCSAGCEAWRWITGPGGFSDAWTAAGNPDRGITTFNAFYSIPILPLHDLPRLEKWMHQTCDSMPQFAHYPGHVMEHQNYRIDWILTRGAPRATEARVDTRDFDGRTPSDHYPVIAALDWAD